MSLDEILQQFQLMLNQINLLWEKAQLYYLKIPSEELAMQIIIIAIFIILALTIILSTSVMILRIKNNLRASRLKKLESAWEKILITIIMSDEDHKPRAIKVSRRNQLFFVSYLHRFAERLQGHELKLVKALAQPYLVRFAKGLKGGYPELRARNVNILGTFGFPQYIEAIKSALKDPSPIVTMSAARALARPEYPQHCKVILPVLSMFDQWSMNFLASMLTEMGSGAAPDLRRALSSSEESNRVRIACTEALRSIGDLESGKVAAELLKTGIDSELQAALLRLLGQVGIPRHRAIIMDHLKSPHFIVRIHALHALGQIGHQDDGAIIIQALDDKSTWVALHAARTLHQLQRRDLLEAALQSEHSRAAIIRQVLAEKQ